MKELTMISTIWIQRTEAYEGEFAPELIAAADEYTEQDNPEYLDKIYKEALQEIIDGSYYSVKKIIIEVPFDEIDAILSDENIIKGTIKVKRV